MASYIYFTPQTEVEEVNQVAEANGYGPDSLSTPLVDTVTGDPWVGAHSFVDLLVEKPTLWSSEDLTVIREYYPEGDPLSNWQDALTKNNLEVVTLWQ